LPLALDNELLRPVVHADSRVPNAQEEKIARPFDGVAGLDVIRV